MYIILIFFLILACLCNTKNKSGYDNVIPVIPVTSKLEMEAMYDILIIMDTFMKKYNIEYFLLSGTLLGGIRNNPPGILYWDDDVDVGVLKNQVEKIELMIKDPEFVNLVEMKRHDFGYQLYPRKHRSNNKDNKEFIYDIFVYEKNKDRYSMINGSFKNAFIPSLDYIYPIKHKPFWDMNLPFPNKPREILEINLGKDVMNTIKYYNHTNTGGMNGKTSRVTKDTTIPLHFKHYETIH
jgi:hypothetical protein